MQPAQSPAELAALQLIELFGVDGAHAEADRFLDSLSIVEQAAHEADWQEFWARPKQLPPAGPWQDWGFLGGRGLGKTLAGSKFVNAEVRAGRARSIGLAAQDEDNCIKLQVTGPSGLISTAAPDFKPVWHVSDLELVWPNGAKAYVRTPEVPGKVRGFDYHLSWLVELQSWPVPTRAEGWMNFLIATRLGYSRIVWDATPKRGHPIIKRLLANGEADPTRHAVVRGSTYENPYLSRQYIGKIEDEIGGTQRGREELFGEQLDESENALIQKAWIEAARRPAPERLLRRVVAIDPAVTSRKGNDRTGIIDEGLGADGQCYVLGDFSDKHAPSAWANIVLDLYALGADCVVVETNKGGDLVTQNLRAHADKRKLQVVVLGKEERPRHLDGIVYIREVHARGEKADRAQPLATAYQRGRVSHVHGVNLEALEELLTTWEPTPGSRSPDALDALTHATSELLGLSTNVPDKSAGFKGIVEVGKALLEQPRPSPGLSVLFSGVGSANRI